MAIIKDFSKRKVSISMAFTLVAIFGLIAITELPIELFPPIEQPVFQVKVEYEVNNYKLVEQSVTKRVERQVSSLDGVLFTEAMSYPNYSLVNVYLDWQKDISSVLLQARERLDQLRLPLESTRPLIIKKDPSRFPAFSYVIKGKPVESLSEIVETHLSRLFDQIDGVAEAEFIGTRERRIVLKPIDSKLKEYNISYAEIIQQIQSLPQTSSGAIIKDGFREWSLRINDFLRDINDLDGIILFQRDNRNIYLSELCEARIDFVRENQFLLSGSEQGILVHLIKESRANLVESADNVYQQIEKLKEYYPDLEFIKVFDGSQEIKKAIYQLIFALIIGGIFSFLILIFFFKTIRIPLYLAIVIPVSILGTFIGCWFLNVSINLISLGGLGLGIGMLIDNGIIIIEYVKQRSSMGIKKAVHESIKILWVPMLTSTLTSLSVFLPLLTIGGMSSVLFKQQAITISLSLAWAYITAITLLPLIIIVFPPDFSSIRKLKNKNWTLMALRHPKVATMFIIAFLISLPLTVYLIDKRLLPDGKSSKMVAALPIDQLKSKDNLLTTAIEINETLLEKSYKPIIYIDDEREFSSERWLTVEVPIESDDDFKAINKILVDTEFKDQWEFKYEKALIRQIVDERQDYATLNVLIKSENDKKRLLKTLDEYKSNIEIIGANNRLFLVLDLKREKLMNYNIPVNGFIQFIQSKLYGTDLGEIKTINRTDRILFTANPDQRIQLSSFLNSSYLFNKRFYRIKEFVDWKIEEEPLWAMNVNQNMTVMIRKSSYDENAKEIMGEIEEKLKSARFILTDDIISYRIKQTNEQLGISLLFSFILILFILAVQFESLRHPLLIVSIVPLSFTGAFIFLYLFNESINVISLTGMIILMGIVINDTILKIDAIQKYRMQGMSLLKSVLKGSHTRLNAIILTTLSTVVASIPLLFGSEGLELRRPIAIVLIAGMMISTYITIQIIPMLYLKFIPNEEFKS
jgi:hydrophobic/amphiphilic exporter-1 (mainly G- bacteria), HAE1 family